MIYEFLQIDKQSGRLYYEQLYESFKAAISGGLIKKGDRLPSVRRLSADLDISRTTVQTAYDQLCAEGYIESRPQKGYFAEAELSDISFDSMPDKKSERSIQLNAQKTIEYDFSGSGVDPDITDIKYWQRCIKNVLDEPQIITSYGDPQGEYELRSTLCEYSRRLRGVKAAPDRIVIGAGTQTLLSILLGLCSDYGFDAALEKGFFPQGEQIFSDMRWSITPLSADKNGIVIGDDISSRVVFVNSSGSNRGSSPIPVSKRAEIIRWANDTDSIIIEDDYNGELRYTSKPVPALQGMCESRVVYIGSFSKLLLPSVRLSYMVLPESLAEVYSQRKANYNQTASKVEQLALSEYISAGRLERQLRKLRKLYGERSELMCSAAKEIFSDAVVEVIETALCVRIKLKTEKTIDTIRRECFGAGIKLGKIREKNGLKYFYLSFAAIPEDKLKSGLKELALIVYDR